MFYYDSYCAKLIYLFCISIKFNKQKLLASVCVQAPKREVKCVTLDADTFKAMLKACENGEGIKFL